MAPLALQEKKTDNCPANSSPLAEEMYGQDEEDVVTRDTAS